jgi:hypothetical protein
MSEDQKKALLTNGESYPGMTVATTMGISGDENTRYLTNQREFLTLMRSVYPRSNTALLDQDAHTYLQYWVSHGKFTPTPPQYMKVYIRWRLWMDAAKDESIVASVVRDLFSSKDVEIEREKRLYLSDFAASRLRSSAVVYNVGVDMTARRQRARDLEAAALQKLFRYKQLRTDAMPPQTEMDGDAVVLFYQDERELRERLKEMLDRRMQTRANVPRIPDTVDIEFRMRYQWELDRPVEEVEEAIQASFAREQARLRQWNQFLAMQKEILADPFLNMVYNYNDLRLLLDRVQYPPAYERPQQKSVSPQRIIYRL